MGLPTIAPYALPTTAEVPVSRAPWRLDASRAALLVHDMQNYFVGAFPADEPPIRPVIAAIAALRRGCHDAGVPVFYSAQPGAQAPRDRGLQADFWGPGMTSAPEHRDIVRPLQPAPGDRLLTKWRYSAFQRTTLEADLQALGRDQLIVTGVYASIGCLLTAADAFMRDIQPFVVADAVADFSRARHDEALAYVAGRCAVTLVTEQALHVLHGAATAGAPRT